MKITGYIKNIGSTKVDPNGKWEKTDMTVGFTEEFLNQEPMNHEMLVTCFQPLNRDEVEKAVREKAVIVFFVNFSVRRGTSKTTGNAYEMQDIVVRFLSPIKR